MNTQAVTFAPWRTKGLGILRIVFGLVWAIDAGFKWQPDFINNFATYLSSPDGQPPWIQAWINFWINVIKVDPHVFAHLIAIGETAVAIGLLFGLLSNLTYIVGALLSVVIWTTAEGFGGPYTSSSTDIGAAIIYVLVFAGLFLAAAGLFYGVDRYLDPRVGRWNILFSGSGRRKVQQAAFDASPVPEASTTPSPVSVPEASTTPSPVPEVSKTSSPAKETSKNPSSVQT